MRKDIPTKQLHDVHKDDNDDTDINAIKLLISDMSSSRYVLDSGANRLIVNNDIG